MNAIPNESKKHKLAGPLFPVILALVVFSIFSISIVVVYTFGSLDSLGKDNHRKRIQVGLNVEGKRLQDLLQEYAYWDEAHEQLLGGADPQWLKQNAGAYLYESYGLDGVIAFNGNKEVVTALYQGQPHNWDVDTLLAAGVDKLHNEQFYRSEYHSSGFLEYGDDIYMIASSFFRDEATGMLKSDISFLVFLQKIDQQYVEDMAELYQLLPLTLVKGAPAMEVDTFLSVGGAEDQSLFNIRWQHKKVSGYLHNVLAAAIFIVCAVIIVLRVILVGYEQQRRKYEKRLTWLANIDSLTKALTRRAFMEKSGTELNRSDRGSMPVSVMLMDVDHFKKVNDAHGHQTGDLVLQGVAALVRDSLRDFDVFGRYGGEEFVVLLPETDLEQAVHVAERCRKLIASSPFVSVSGESLTCSVSIGICQRRPEEGLESLLGRADHLLYVAKDSGRNQCQSSI